VTMAKLPIIVCVDDEPLILATVSRCLRREQLDVRTTDDPREALTMISQEEVAVIVSDYEMPQMTGAQLAGRARRLRPETVRILLTGKRTLETAVDGINQGEIFRFIAKPFDHNELRSAVLSGVERHRELLELSGDRQRRERREVLRAALEIAHPGISTIQRDVDSTYEVGDPWKSAATLGLASFTAELERKP
jgi:DNA-binding NtrC family response regulator